MTVFKIVNEAKNLALKVELMIQEQSNRFGGGRKNYGYDSVCSSNRVVGEKNKGVVEKSAGGVEKKDDKAEGKKLMEPKETLRQSNPYAKPILGKCYRCNQPGHQSMNIRIEGP